ncbi:hypothetical protein HOC13_03420 [Candidatus Woesearchaeota archaeon]|nr:hypothetical protein [Candidatus Woesearchaeota archaeon]
MVKKNLTSLELAAMTNELQFLVRGKISQIYHQDKKELLFQIHVPGEGKVFLKVTPGKFIYITEKKNAPLKPSGFCMQLRKYLDGAFIKKIEQRGSERVLVVELEKKEKYSLVLEMFSKGNLILMDEKGKIITVLEWQIWKDRTVKPGEKYIFPEEGVDWRNLDLKGLGKVIRGSGKKSLAIALAMDVRLGGVYAEEVCKVLGLDKEIPPKDVSDDQLELVFDTIKQFLKKIEKPMGCVYEEEIAPFLLMGRELKEERQSYSGALDTLKPVEVVSPQEKKIQWMKGIIKKQEETMDGFKVKIEENAEKGEWIYNHYSQLQKLLELIEEMKKEKSWEEIKKELKKEKKIKQINLKEKKVVLVT